MDKKVRVTPEIDAMINEVDGKFHGGYTAAARFLMVQGYEFWKYGGGNSLKKPAEKPEIDTEMVLEGLENAAAGGTDALADYLAGLNVHEEQAVKYHIKAAKKAAQAADDEAMLGKMPEIRAELDVLCLEGQAVLQAFHDKLPRAVQLELKADWHTWWRDAGYSDSVLKLKGKRPANRRDPKLWERDKEHSETAVDNQPETENNGQVMDSENAQKTKAGKRLCPKTLKYID